MLEEYRENTTTKNPELHGKDVSWVLGAGQSSKLTIAFVFNKT